MESYVLQVVDQPLPGVERALVIAGSDRRGTIYGIYELSERLGVSPWYWWADVPVDAARFHCHRRRTAGAGAAGGEISRHFSQRRGLVPAAMGGEDL